MSTSAARRSAELDAREAEHDRRLAALEARVALLERVGRDRDKADTDLRQLLPTSTRALPFTAKQLLRHARVDEALQAALQAADIDSTASLGTWLRGRAGSQHGV